jgi:hypothetical protein
MKYVKFSNDDDDDDDDNDNNDSDRNPLVANAVSSHRQIDLEKNGSLSEEELARGDSVQLMAASPRSGATAMSPGQSFELVKSRGNTKGGGLEDQL